MQNSNKLITEYVENYMEKVFYFCLKKTGDSYEAEDLSSDITVCVFSGLRRGVIPVNFPAWVWQIARNRYSKWADGKHRKAESVTGADIGELELADDTEIENEYVNREDLSLLRRELAFISSDYRDIVVAYYIDDRSVKDIAASLNLPKGTVTSKLFRARNILKEGMNMAREFGTKSYNPEEIRFASSGNQSSGLPFNAVNRKIPKNILLQASNNPSTIEELSMELGVAVPYMEEEVDRLVSATLLRKIDNKYVTDFYIADKESQLNMYMAQRCNSKERSKIVDEIADDTISAIRRLGIVRNDMTDMDIKWWLVIHIVDYCISQMKKYNIEWPEKRSNGETWGFIGYENIELPEHCFMGHNGSGNENAMFWSYKISGYDMWDRRGEMEYDQVLLLSDLIKNKRTISSLTPSEKHIWEKINGRFVHVDEKGTVIPDILVFEGTAKEKVNAVISEHPKFEALSKNIEEAFEKTIDILKENSIELLQRQLPYCASMQILLIRMMTVNDEVEDKKLIVPTEPNHSTAAMWIEIK